MAAKGTIGGKIVLEGEKQYREALKNIKTDQQQLRSEMRLCQSEFKNSQNSIDALTKKHEILTKQYETQAKKVDVYQKAVEESAQKQEKAASKVSELQDALDKAEKELDKMTDGSEENADAVANQSKVIEDLKNKLVLAEEGYNKAENKTKSYQTALNNATAELNTMQDDLEKTAKYLQEAENSTDKCATSIDEYGKETEDATQKTSIFGDVLKANLASEVITSGIKKIAEGIKEAADAALEVGKEFEASMSKVAAISGATGDELQALKDKAKEMGATTIFSASESAEALQYMAMAGWKTQDMLDGLEGIMNLAAASGEDLAKTSDIVTDALTAFGLSAEDSTHFADILAVASSNANTNVGMMGETFKYVAPVAGALGFSAEDAALAIGLMANSGTKASQAGTALRSIMSRMAKPTDQVAAAMDTLGVSLTDGYGNMLSLNQIMLDLRDGFEGLSEAEKASVASALAGQEAMAGLLAIVTASDEVFNNLENSINNCDGSAKKMADTMNDNLKGKVTILNSTLEGLGISIYEVFDDDLKMAVDGATDAVGKLQKSVERGDLGVSLNKMSKALGEFCENALEVGEDALPGVIDGFTWILENGDLVVSCLAAIVAGQVAMSVVPKIITACNAAWGAYQLVTQGAATWQEVLNVAMAANPAGLLLTAITALAAGVAAYVIINKDNLSAMDEVTRATKDQVEASKELNSQYANAVADRATKRQELETEAASCKKLVSELKDLTAKTSLTSQEQARMQLIVEQLNEAMPNLNLAIDEQTGELNMSTQALEDNVEAMMALARAEAAREDLTQIAKDQYEAEKQLADLREQMKEQQDAVTAAQDNYNRALEENAAIWDDVLSKEYYEPYELAKEAQAELQSQIDATQESIQGFTEEYEQTLDYISDTEAQATATAATAELGNAAETAGGQMVAMSEEAMEAMQEMYDSVYETVQGQIDLFSEFNGEMELTKEELLANMQSQVDGIQQWADNLETLAERGIDQGLLQHLANMGPEGAGYVATFVEMSDEELQKANELFAEALSLPEETTSKVMESYETAGKNAAEGFKTGITDNAEDVATAAGDMAQDTLDEAKKTLDINSPSKEFETIGQYVDEGFASGIKNNQQIVIDIVAALCSKTIQTGKNMVTKSEWEEIGSRIPEGMKQGIENGTSSVVSAVEKMATKAVESAKKTLDVNSPSKKFEYLGKMSGEGYITGWRGSMSGIEDVIADSFPDEDTIMDKADSKDLPGTGKAYSIQQEINIYNQTDNPIEAAKRFKDAQKEAAEQW